MAAKKVKSDVEPSSAQLSDDLTINAIETSATVTPDPESGTLQAEELVKPEVSPDATPQSEAKPKKTRVTVPKKEITIILDGGRSRIKVLLIVDGQVTTNLVIDSVVCQTDAPPFGELGAFSVSHGKDENKKDVVEHWVVGSSAKLQGKPFVAMSDGENHKVDYFPILALGAIAPSAKSLRTFHWQQRKISLIINQIDNLESRQSA